MYIKINQLNYKKLDFEGNFKKIEESMTDNALNVFSSMCLTGSGLKTSLSFKDTELLTHQYIDKILELKKDCIIGYPTYTDSGNIFNTIALIINGQINNILYKKNIKNSYDDFNSNEHVNSFITFSYKGQNIWLAFYDDYKDIPQDRVNENDYIILIKDGVVGDNTEYIDKTSKMIIVNRVGVVDSYIYCGNSSIGKSFHLDAYKESSFLYDTDKELDEKNDINEHISYSDMIISSLRYYFDNNGFRKAVIGLSGGIDSAVVATLAVEALGAENVIGVLMPSKFSSDHSMTDSIDLAKNLKINTYTIPITDTFDTFLASLTKSDAFANTDDEQIARENIQARIRMTYIMSLCNKYNALMLNTSNKSESAMGYGTIYGDDAGSISPIGDLYKTQVYSLAYELNKIYNDVIPINTIKKAPSAELSIGQKDTDSLPPYDILDNILNLIFTTHMSREDLYKAYNDKELIDKIFRNLHHTEWKRRQEAPAFQLSNTCFTTKIKL